MNATEHHSYAGEAERCRSTLEYVEKSLNSSKSRKDKIDKTLEHVKKHFNSDNSQNYIDLIINSQMQNSLELKLRNLVTAMSKPYFARIDFAENEGKREKLYIGKMSLMREEDQEVIIVDWRAPVANLYYEGRLGEAEYQCPDGSILGELLLKRQFSIDGGVLKQIFDIDITTNDQFLQTYLGANADNRLKEIVSTIQVEQNMIVRADMWTPLIVQGVAGSGKTTIALHRIAYLIYTFEKSFQPENFMIIAPNKLFLNYISEVLPELGVEKVKQTTFEEFAMELIGKRFKVRDANEKLTLFVNSGVSPEQEHRNEMLKRSAEFKSSIEFKELLDDYIEHIEKSFIPKENFEIANKTVYSHEEINRLFQVDYKRWPIAYRINEIKKHLNSRLKIKRDEIINSLHDECSSRISYLRANMEDTPERQSLVSEAVDRKNGTIDKLESLSKKAVGEYIKKISKLSPYQYYKDLMEDRDLFIDSSNGRLDANTAEFIRESTLGVLKSGDVEIEDLAPIIYLKFRIYGMDEKIPVKHIVIDEAQDFSVFQLYVIKNIVKDSSFTILGDLSQGIHSYRGTRDWNEVFEKVFSGHRCRLLKLEQSYRTTVEIMEAANRVIGRSKSLGKVLAKPVIRHGEKVRIVQIDDMKSTAAQAVLKIKEAREAGFKSAAVICKTISECEKMFLLLKKSVEGISLITGKEDSYKGGVVIVPSYLSKGLEFDVVIIANGSEEEYSTGELDIKLLYVAMTRALHRLYIYHLGKPSVLLEGI